MVVAQMTADLLAARATDQPSSVLHDTPRIRHRVAAMQLLRPLVKTWIEDEDASLTGKCLRMVGFAVFIIPFGFFGLAGRLFIFCLLLGLSYLVELRLGRAAGWISGALLYRG